MPFVAFFGKTFPEYFIGIASMIISFICAYFISKTFKFKPIDSLWLALFFVFSTVLFSASLIEISAYQVEVLGVPLILLSLREYFTKKRPILIGFFLALAVLTRPTLILSAVFFLFEFLQKRMSKKELAFLLLPIVFACIVFGLYNQRRFHSFSEFGYQYSRNLHSFPLSENLKYGYMSLSHVPANLYGLLLIPPEPIRQDNSGFVLKFPYLKASPWGMAIWYTSPLFLVLLYKFKKNKYTISALITCVVMLLPILTYYSIGFAQFGYRYALDFLPFLFLILLSSLNSKLSKKEMFLIAIGVIFNCIYITSLWGVYPLLGIK